MYLWDMLDVIPCIEDKMLVGMVELVQIVHKVSHNFIGTNRIFSVYYKYSVAGIVSN